MLQIGARSHATGAIPVVQRVVERVLSFHHLLAGKPKWKIRVGNKLWGMHQLYMGLWRFHYNENFHCFNEGALEVCHRYRNSSMTSSTYPQHFYNRLGIIMLCMYNNL